MPSKCTVPVPLRPSLVSFEFVCRTRDLRHVPGAAIGFSTNPDADVDVMVNEKLTPPGVFGVRIRENGLRSSTETRLRVTTATPGCFDGVASVATTMAGRMTRGLRATRLFLPPCHGGFSRAEISERGGALACEPLSRGEAPVHGRCRRCCRPRGARRFRTYHEAH